MEYNRVLPRDLFNESKLLKCLGRLILIVEDTTKIEGLSYILEQYESKGFIIKQSISDGNLYVENLKFNFNGIPIRLESIYNSKDIYPLLCDDYIKVFDEHGEIDVNFTSYLNTFTYEKAIVWSVQDFKTLAYDIYGEKWGDYCDEKKFKYALDEMILKHDANVGITWDTVESYLKKMCTYD